MKHWRAALMCDYLSNYTCTRSAIGWNVYNWSGKMVGAFVPDPQGCLEFLTPADMRRLGVK